MRSITAALCLFALSASLVADEIRGKVVSITDGDTVVVLDTNKVQHKIRLEGIDAPEKGQAFGQKSKSALGDKIHAKEVVVKWTKRDRYQRILGDIYLGDRRLSLEMVQEGWAWHYRQYNSEKVLADAEVAARAAKKGLWAESDPTPPWDFRKKQKAK